MIGMPPTAARSNFLFAAAAAEITEIGHGGFAARENNQVRFAKLVAGFDVTQPHAWFSFKGIEVIEVGDMRQGDDGDIEVEVAAIFHRVALFQRDGIFLGDMNIVVVGHYAGNRHAGARFQPIQSRL